jgi:phosphosulfolactate synthase
MNQTALSLPARSAKPRATGITMVVDGGVPFGALRDIVDSAGEYLDFVKFGWGTAVVSGELGKKIDMLRANDVEFYFGGTLFEKHVLQGRFDDFRELCHAWSCRYVEASNGTIDLSNTEKAGYVRKLAKEFQVISEVGFKDADRSDLLSPRRWIEYAEEDLLAGAQLVTLEARESGRSGICHADGQLRVGLVEEVVTELPRERLLFEAPTTALQAHMVRRVGPNVNLGNVPPASVLALETLRLGLRADTLTDFEEPVDARPDSLAGVRA